MGLFTVSQIASADVIWPALVLEQRLWSLPPILSGLAVELVVLLWAFRLPFGEAVLVDVVMNLGSTLAGTLLIPLGGLAWEIGPGLPFADKLGTFNPYAWAATFLIAVGATTLIEAFIVKKVFEISLGRRRFLWLCAANCASVGIAFASFRGRPAT